MDEQHAAVEITEEMREVAADVHHRLGQERAKGDADAAAHVVAQARASGVPKEVCDQMAAETFQRIAQQIAPPRRRRWQLRKDRGEATESESHELPAGGTAPKLLPQQSGRPF